MHPALKRILKPFLMRFPRLGILGLKVARPFRFQPERLAWRGGDQGPGNGRPSLVFFTHYRCGSMMLDRRLGDLLDGLDYKRINFQGYVHPWSIERREDFQRNRDEHARVGRFVATGRFYSPLRYYVDIPDLPTYKVLVVLRDPRDVLVSRYFSERYAHVRLDDRFLEHCERVESMELDRFVLEYAEQVEEHYRLFMDHAEDLRHALVISYEEVISDFEGFLRRVNEYADLGRSEEYVAEVAARESFTVTSEDKYAHKRSVKARNFEDKLAPETIAALNERFADVLDHFGWTV